MGGLGVVGTRVARWTVGRVVPGHICYVTDAELRDRLASGTGRAYLAGGKITSAYLESSWLRLISRWEDTTPEELAAIIKADMARIGKVIKNAGIHADKLQISSGGLIRNSET